MNSHAQFCQKHDQTCNLSSEAEGIKAFIVNDTLALLLVSKSGANLPRKQARIFCLFSI